jgi:hypothetical protein
MHYDPSRDPRYEHLREFYVPWHEIREHELVKLSECLGAAHNEAAMQVFLETYPRFLLQHLTPSRGYWVIPSKRLGAEHVTDFLIGEPDTHGLTWQAVELERPQAIVFTRGGDPSAALTHALRQISDWRSWLSHNRDYAARSPDNAGLGLTDIDPELNGLVIIGRQSQSDRLNEQRRRRLARDTRTGIHTYDWLVRQGRERLVAASTPLAAIGAMFGPRREGPDDVISHVFDGPGTVYADLSATRSITWEEVYFELDGQEHPIFYKELRKYGSGPQYLSPGDWNDWLQSPELEVADHRFRLLASETQPNDALKQSLTSESEGLWYELRGLPYLHYPDVNVLLHLPADLSVGAKMLRVRRSLKLFASQVR